MKKLIALFLFIAMLFSLASCGEPAPEPPATDDTPKDEGFEQGYLFCHEAELCNPWEFTYSERQYDIIAYRSEVKSFDRSTSEDIELEISYGTFSDALKPYVTQRLYIPSFPPEATTSESLNVAVATAITCAEFRRRSIKI